MVLVTGEGLPTGAALRSVPWWGYVGGPFGVVGVAGTILLIPRLGAAGTVALNITGQMLMSLVLDGEGLLGCRTGRSRRSGSPARRSSCSARC